MEVLAKSLSSVPRVLSLSCGYCSQQVTQSSSHTHSCPSSTHSPLHSSQVPPAAATPTARRVSRRTELDYEELRALQLAGDIALIDVRDTHELENYGEIPGSLNIPLNKIKGALQLSHDDWVQQFNMQKPDLMDRNLVFYARGPNASSTAVEIAHRLGFKRSRQYTGGWEDYCRKTGMPLKKTHDNNLGNYYASKFDQYFL